jgi:antitoxin component YwqK of YwqJK toxin-antitoxin module
MINEQTFQDAYIAKLSGVAEYNNEKEIWWDVGEERFTIEFVNDSVSKAIVRSYFDGGRLRRESNYENGVIHGKLITYWDNGNKCIEKYFKNGWSHGRLIVWSIDGLVVSDTVWEDGDEVVKDYF